MHSALPGGAQRLLHAERGIARPHGVIFMGNRRAEEGHEAISEHLIHRALVAMHRRHHAVHRRIEELLGGFRVEPGDQLRRAFDVREKDGDVLAFAGLSEGARPQPVYLREVL